MTTFELQNASLGASLALLETGVASQRNALEQFDTAARQAQQAALDAFRAQVRAASRLGEPSKR
jgi:hypothetical protein